ncbi:MAG: Snf7 [Nitrososphaeraceae archaeon]|nr:Snf7 [Nitrososphaeraceae archaeon]
MEKYPQLKSKLDNASSVVNNQLAKLRMLDNRFTTLDTDLRAKVIVNIKNGDNLRAKALANELANIRKIKNTTQKLLLSLEVIVIRFSTISEFAEVLDTINPMIETIKEVKDDIRNTVPTATNIISEISTLTSDVLIQSNMNLNIDPISVPVNSDAIDILNEVQNIMEEETKVKLPSIPNSITNKNKSIVNNKEISNKNPKVLLQA